MKINELLLVLICSVLAAAYFVLLPLGPMWLRISIDMLVGGFIIAIGAVACVKYGEFVGYIVGMFLALFILGRCVEYGLIEPLSLC